MKLFYRLLPGIASMLLMSTVFFIAPLANLAALEDKVYIVRFVQALSFNLLWGACLPYALLVMPTVVARALALLLIVLTIVFSVFSVLHLKLYGQLIAAPSVSALLDTNKSEAVEFITFSSSLSTMLAVGLVLAITIVLAVYMYRGINSLIKLNFPKPYAKICLCFVVGLTLIGWNRVTFSLKNPVTFIVQTGYEVLANRAAYVQMKNLHPEPSGAVLKDTSNSTHIIIIGESATPSHLSLYGYERITDPFARASASTENPLVKFYFSRNACSSQPNTQLSLSDVMLAERKLKGSSAEVAPPNMISIFKDAGFKVFWISNQSGGAGHFSLGSVWGYFADKPEFLNKKDFREGYDFDDVLLPSLKKALADPAKNKIIFVHLLGSHPDYKQRYPSEFKKWELTSEVPAIVPRRNDSGFDREKYNAYDNSLVYTDFILSKIVEMGSHAGVSSIIYFSDHGNNLGEKSTLVGHSLVTGPRQGFEIPMLFWVNRTYLATNPKSFESLEINLQKPINLDKIQYTLFDLYHINYLGSDPSQSLLSNYFIVTQRHCDSFQ